MNTNNNEYSRKTVGIACGLLFFAYIGCYHYLVNEGNKKPIYEKRPDIELSKPNNTCNINSGQRTYKTIKSINIKPSIETYEVSQWVTSGDWSYDNYPLTVTIPSQTVVMDIDYVEDHWDDYLDDPEDELRFPTDIFQ